MKSRWIIGFLLMCVLAISANAQENSSVQSAQGPIANVAPQHPGGATSPATQLQLPAGTQDAGTYPDRLEEVLGAMSAELAEIAQAAREGKISRDQAEYLSLERYYVALSRFQLLRTRLPAAAGEQSVTKLRAGEYFTPGFREWLRYSSARLLA